MRENFGEMLETVTRLPDSRVKLPFDSLRSLRAFSLGMACHERDFVSPSGKTKSSRMAGSTGLEPAASGVTGRRSNQLNYDPKLELTLNRINE